MLNLIVAPYEVAENGENFCKRIVSYLKQEKVEYAVYFHKNLDDIIKSVADATALNENEFVVIGNDATINAFVNAVKDLSKIKFGIVPTSNKDDFAKYIGLSSNPVQAIKDILLKKVEPTDYILCNNIKAVNTILIGASVEVFEKFNAQKVKNFITQKISAMQYGNKFEGVELTFNFKGNKDKTETIFELSIANGGLTNGKKTNPLANVSDGLFNFNYAILLEPQERKKYLGLFKNGEQIYKENTSQYWLDSLKITQAENKIKALIDGRIFNLEEMNLSIIEGGLKLYRNLNSETINLKKPAEDKEEKPAEKQKAKTKK